MRLGRRVTVRRVYAAILPGYAPGMAKAFTHRVREIVAALVADGKLDPHIEDIRPLDKAADAIASVEVGHAKGKVVIEVST
jgi:NADPH:quinone reductase-like Zn-dependent oxidoreductase